MRKTISAFMREGGWLRAIPFVLLFIYCLTVYQFIPEMWDDFYFGGLCAWGYTEPNVVGTNFTFEQLINFASHLYMNRLPRVLTLVLMNAPLLRIQWIYRIVNSLAITATFYGIYKFSSVKRSAVNTFATVIMFGLLSQRLYTEGAFWFSAAMVTFVPGAFLFCSLLAFKKLEYLSGRKRVGITISCSVLTLLTCLMQEQIAVTLSGTIAFIVLYKFISTKKVPVAQCVVLFFSCTGSAAICFGPGNLNRFDNEVTTTLSERVTTDLDNFIATVFHKSNMPFLIVFLFFICYLSYLQEGTHKQGLPFIVVCLWSAAFIPLSLYHSPESILTLMNPNYSIHSVPMAVCGTLYLCYAMLLIARQLKRINDWYLSMFALCGLLSVLSSFFYANYIVHRMEITWYLSLFCIMLRVFADETSAHKYIAFAGTATISCVWLSIFMLGYAKNAPILKDNRDILISASARFHAGEEIVTPILNLSFDRYFTPKFIYPGEPGYPDLPWDVLSFKEFYGLPETVEIGFRIE